LIKTMLRRAEGRIEVLPAAGINSRTVSELLIHTGCNQIHASLRGKQVDSSTLSRPDVTFVSRVPSGAPEFEATDPAAVAELVALVRQNAGVTDR
jgi:copper homeostasis protein